MNSDRVEHKILDKFSVERVLMNSDLNNNCECLLNIQVEVLVGKLDIHKSECHG